MFRLHSIIVLFIIASSALSARDYALILAFRCGDRVIAEEAADANMKFRDFCIRTGTLEEDILVLSADDMSKGKPNVTPESIIRTCKSLAERLTGQDTLRIMFTGYVSNRLLISVKNGRLAANSLADALHGIKAQREYYFFTSNSYALAEALHKDERLAISGADSKAQATPPKLASFLMEALIRNRNLLADKNITLTKRYQTVLKEAADQLHDRCKKQNLAVSENAMLFADGKTTVYPFGDGQGARSVPPRSESHTISTVSATEPVTSVKPSDNEKVRYLQYMKEAGQFPDAQLVQLKKTISFYISEDHNDTFSVEEIYFIRKAASVTTLIQEKIPPDAEIRIVYPDGTTVVLAKGIDTQTLPYIKNETVLAISYKGSVKNTQTDEFDQRILFGASYPVCAGSITIETPSHLTLHTRLIHSQGNFIKTVSQKTGNTLYSFDFGSIKGHTALPGDPSQETSLPGVLVTTRKDWSTLAAWTRRMMKNAFVLNEKDRNYVRDLIGQAQGSQKAQPPQPGVSSILEVFEDTPTSQIGKLKIIYNAVQSIRYLTTPVGAAAFRPQTVSEIRERGYADCKDKANMLVRLAAEYGIRGYCVLVNRFSDTNPEIPAWQFNHMLAYFPAAKNPELKKDLWLDPTDGYTPFGTLPPGDEGITGMVLCWDEETPYEFKQVQSAATQDSTIGLELDCDFTDDCPKAVFSFRMSAYTLYAPELARAGKEDLFHIAESLLHDYLPGAEAVKVSMDKELTRLFIELSKDSPSKIDRINLLPDQARDAFRYTERPNGLRINLGMPYSFRCNVIHKFEKDYIGVLGNAKQDGLATITTHKAKRDGSSQIHQTFSIHLPKTSMTSGDYKVIRDFLKKNKAL